MTTDIQTVPAEAQQNLLHQWKLAVHQGVELAPTAIAVRTSDGPAIMIGGDVIHIASANSELHTEIIVRALRILQNIPAPEIDETENKEG